MEQSPELSSYEITEKPSFNTLRGYLFLLAAGIMSALFLPITLALNLSGRIASDGPSNEIKAPADSIIKEIAKENIRINRGDALFQFEQPLMSAEIQVLEEKISSLNVQIDSSTQQCISVKSILDQNLSHAKELFALKRNAYEIEAISMLNLLGARADLDIINREMAVHEKQCAQDKERLLGEKKVIEKELSKQLSSIALTESVTAPSNGYLHRVSIKPEQKVSAGQLLGIFTSEGTAGATFIIPLRDRPFINVGDKYLVTSEAYQILNNPPIRSCTITAISPDSFAEEATEPREGDRISFQAQCQFNETPLTGDYPFLVGMQVNGSATSVRATLVQILIEGYRRLMVNQD